VNLPAPLLELRGTNARLRLPGERARVTVHEGVRADLIEVLEPSAERVALGSHPAPGPA
jgi:hypothetical protein